MAFRLPVVNFSKGEIAPHLYGRIDVQSYASGLKKARNVIGLKYGGQTKRPGFRLVAEVHDADHDVRLIPFQFDEGKSGQNYALEMGQGYMRPAALGGMVLETQLAITGITNDVNAEVEAAFHGYSVGDSVYISGQSGMTEINGRIAHVMSVVDDDHFTININTVRFGVWTANSGGITRTVAPDPDPTPPTVPPIVIPPDPPEIGGGGWDGTGNIP